MEVRLIKSFGFEAAHWLPTFPPVHTCRRTHGHSVLVDVAVQDDWPPEQVDLIDHGQIKAALEPIRKQLDHYCLNEIAGLENPTSEVLAGWIWDRVKPGLPMLTQIVVHETCSARCEYRGPANDGAGD